MTDKRRDTEQADRQLDGILDRVTYTGPEPRPSEDNVMAMVVEEIRAGRRRRKKRRVL